MMAMAHPFRRMMPPVHSPVVLPALARALASGITRGSGGPGELEEELRRTFDVESVVLTDSGTSALVLAYRMVARRNRRVAIPAYGCPDLVSAALQADVGLRLYDIDPRTLSPDPASVEEVLGRGVDAIVVVHFFGLPADVPMVMAMAEKRGVRVIEDAAQGAGGFLGGRRLGSLAALSVLSFGRGKGITGGRGGALMVQGSSLVAEAETLRPRATRGTDWKGLSMALAQRILARPALYGIPASIPTLRLGEMVYHDAAEPGGMGWGNATLAAEAVRGMEEDAEGRRAVARILRSLLEPKTEEVFPYDTIEGGTPGYLRFPAMARGRKPAPDLGILRVYPVPLTDLSQTRGALVDGESAGEGCTLLSKYLLTLPTHRQVADKDMARIADWAERG